MKKVIPLLLLCLLLWGCAPQAPAPTTTAAPAPSTTLPPPDCIHVYANADCDSPKTCTLCGATRGNALGHDYLEGVCSRCGKTDATYLPLLGVTWTAICLSENGSQLEELYLSFTEGSCQLRGLRYHRLADVPVEERTDAMLREENWYDYSGEIYYRTESIPQQQLVCTVEGNILTCTLIRDDMTVGTLLLERTAGNRLSVTYCEGEFRAQLLAVGDVFDGSRQTL